MGLGHNLPSHCLHAKPLLVGDDRDRVQNFQVGFPQHVVGNPLHVLGDRLVWCPKNAITWLYEDIKK